MTRQMTSRIPADRGRALRVAGALIGLAVVLGACKHTDEDLAAVSYSPDYRQRHPIAIQEANRSITVRQYHPEDPRHMAAIRLNYPKISAVAGPCGLWPEDLGPSINNKNYFENKQYYNFGCANQRNLAAM